MIHSFWERPRQAYKEHSMHKRAKIVSENHAKYVGFLPNTVIHEISVMNTLLRTKWKTTESLTILYYSWVQGELQSKAGYWQCVSVGASQVKRWAVHSGLLNREEQLGRFTDTALGSDLLRGEQRNFPPAGLIPLPRISVVYTENSIYYSIGITLSNFPHLKEKAID